MKKEVKPFSWIVKNFDCNAQKIKDYDILKYQEDDIKKLKKKYTTKEEFAEALRRECMYRFWSKAEWELIIECTEDSRVILRPWCGCYNPDEVKIDVTDDTSFDWQGFAAKHIRKQIFKNKAKIDVWDQIEYRWDEFVEYVWEYHHKWQRTKKVSV